MNTKDYMTSHWYEKDGGMMWERRMLEPKEYDSELFTSLQDYIDWQKKTGMSFEWKQNFWSPEEIHRIETSPLRKVFMDVPLRVQYADKEVKK